MTEDKLDLKAFLKELQIEMGGNSLMEKLLDDDAVLLQPPGLYANYLGGHRACKMQAMTEMVARRLMRPDVNEKTVVMCKTERVAWDMMSAIYHYITTREPDYPDRYEFDWVPGKSPFTITRFDGSVLTIIWQEEDKG